MSQATPSMSDLTASWTEVARKNARGLTIVGVVSVIAGVLAVLAPLVSGLFVTAFVGVALCFGGGARLIGAFHAGSFGQGALAFIGGALTLVAGLIMIARPGLGLVTLTLVMAIVLLVDGTFGAVLAFHVRPHQGWGAMLFGAIVALVLGILLLAEWPLSGAWAIGTLVGVNLLFAGTSMMSIGSAAKRLAAGGASTA